MDFFNIGDKINVKDLNALTYLLRKFKRLNAGLRLGALTLESDYGSFSFDKPLTSVGGNFIIEEEVNVSSNDCLRNCFYSFVFSVIDVNTSGTVNKRQVRVTGGTGDDGTLFVTLPTDLIESDEVILPVFELDIVFDEHEYYTPVVDVVNVELVSDKRFVTLGETATVTATLSDRDGELLVGVPCNFTVNGTVYQEVTDENGQAEYTYTGTGVSTKIDIRVVTTTLTIYDSVMTATVTGGSVSLGRNMIATGDILIDWGDGTTTTRPSGVNYGSDHTYTDGLNEHTICFVGEITSLGESCFWGCTGLTSVVIPNSVVSLGNYCFFGCTGLTSITILNTVTRLGDYCFYGCSALIDYQLYWKDSAILEYVASKMPVNSNTYFTIPQGQRTQYLAKNYPNKIKIRGYDLSLTTDKTIITEDETSTVTATLTYNMEPIADETVSYTIRQGATIIDTGSDTTDSNGQIEVEYTGTSIGKITIQITYDTLTETSIIYDTIFYDPAITGQKNTNYTTGRALTVTTNNIDTIISSTMSNSGNGRYMQNTGLTGDFEVEFNIKTIYKSNVGIYFGVYNGSLFSIARVPNSKWNKGRFKRVDGEYTAEIQPSGSSNWRELSLVNDNAGSGEVYWVFYIYNQTGDTYSLGYYDLLVYSVDGSSKVDTSISIGSDKASYYTDESIVLTGSLTDEDDLPLVGADVKVYRGASIVLVHMRNRLLVYLLVVIVLRLFMMVMILIKRVRVVV